MVYDGIKIADGAVDAILGIGKVAPGARIAFAGLNNFTGEVSIAGVAFDTVAKPIDLSNNANQLTQMIKALEEHRDKIKEDICIE